MAHDYEDIHDLDDLSDDELRQVVREHLAANNFVDLDDIIVHVKDGVVRLEGRVGTEGEMRVAERVITDGLGLQNVENELVVDALRRPSTPEDIDEHLVEQHDLTSGLLLGDGPPQDTDEVFLARGDEDPTERAYGTTDVQDSIAHGTPYIPPTGPTPEGLGGADASPGAYGEDH
jgi:hypothetical protein